MKASADRTALMEQAATERAKALKRAVQDVMEGHTVTAAWKSRGVPQDALREELRRLGWTPPHFSGDGKTRRTGGSGKRRGTQLPRAKDDNQT